MTLRNTLAALATVAVFAAGAASAAPVNISFSSAPTQSGASLTFEDVTITGSDTVYNLFLNGLGIVNSVVSNGQSITFSFSQLVDNVSISIGVAGGGSAGVTAGLRTVDVFDNLGNLLGSEGQSLTGTFDISAIAGGASLSSFTMTASPTTTFRITQLSYELAPMPEAPAPIPLPAGAPLLLGALGALALIRRRAKKNT